MTRPTILNPKGINKVIEDITLGLAAYVADETVVYLTEDYGQATTLIREVQGRPKRIPAIAKSGNYIEMFPDANLKNLMFGIGHDPAEVDHEAGRYYYDQQFSLIFWFKQDAYWDYEHLATDEIINIVANDIIRTSKHKIKLIKVFKEPENVYAGFDYEIVKSQYLMYPFTGFRLLFDAKFTETC